MDVIMSFKTSFRVLNVHKMIYEIDNVYPSISIQRLELKMEMK